MRRVGGPLLGLDGFVCMDTGEAALPESVGSTIAATRQAESPPV
jgi:hypothetical protein